MKLKLSVEPRDSRSVNDRSKFTSLGEFTTPKEKLLTEVIKYVS